MSPAGAAGVCAAEFLMAVSFESRMNFLAHLRWFLLCLLGRLLGRGFHPVLHGCSGPGKDLTLMPELLKISHLPRPSAYVLCAVLRAIDGSPASYGV